MDYIDAVILGIIQGLTEFIPISSSGHLVLTEHFLNIKMPGIMFELSVHMGTLLSVIIYFRKRIVRLVQSIFIADAKEDRKMVLYLIYGTIPVVIFVLLLRGTIEKTFGSPLATSFLLVVTGLILLSTAIPKKGEKGINLIRAIMIGMAQALAIFPGISRSGISISAGLFAGIKPVKAAEFSFLLYIPAMFAALTYKNGELATGNIISAGEYIVGILVSFLTGLLAVYILLGLIKKGKFQYFGVYCLLIGIFGIIYFIS